MHVMEVQPGSASDRGLSGPPLRGALPNTGGLAKERANPLGSYLRARRERVTPEQAGIAASGARRVPGLRREELAMLAGISADYYLRLERGRDRHPSGQVLDALAGALRLDADEAAHLHVLASQPVARRRGASRDTAVPPSATDLLHSLPHAAFIEDRYLNVIDANEHAVALDARLAPGRNQLRDLILDADERAMYPDADLAAACLIASLRHSIGNDLADPRFVELTDELHDASETFRRTWSRHDVRAQRGATLRLIHPVDGELHLNREQLAINATAGLKLVVYSPVRMTAP